MRLQRSRCLADSRRASILACTCVSTVVSPSVPRIKFREIRFDPYQLQPSSYRSLLFGVTAPFSVAFSRGKHGHLPRDRCLDEARILGKVSSSPGANFARSRNSAAETCSTPACPFFSYSDSVPSRVRVRIPLVRSICLGQYKMASGCLTYAVLCLYLTKFSKWRVRPRRHPLCMWCSTTIAKNSSTLRPEGV
ncbi:hypothetical protein CORC01_05827 [Colletotrichum orchidophilum]|uniref:Uncharacterized protein n=1 Tax=Colletotrichum orchidophilum TaxID=1209926 RepID=A0A1G4BC24_9PEZI|nr:uncharacterized protein CORC01_05827 [Colletotrichum orchidophilum]OHE98931.1 hypothetical protein CORC01_05827 [Colletotrichum orchidophilum]